MVSSYILACYANVPHLRGVSSTEHVLAQMHPQSNSIRKAIWWVERTVKESSVKIFSVTHMPWSSYLIFGVGLDGKAILNGGLVLSHFVVHTDVGWVTARLWWRNSERLFLILDFFDVRVARYLKQLRFVLLFKCIQIINSNKKKSL